MYIAIDMGGTKTLVSAFSGSGKLLQSIRFETPKQYDKYLLALEKAYNDLGDKINDDVSKKHNKSGENAVSAKILAEICVMGAPGKIDRKEGKVVAFGNLDWKNVPLRQDVSRITGLPTVVENDANLAGLSEAILIKHSFNKVLYITISTGIGGGMIIDGKIDPAFADIELGHMVFEHDGQLKKWEDFASGRAIYEKFGQKASEIEDDKIWYEISRNIGLGLTNIIVNTTPEVIVIGGGVGAHFHKFGDRLHEQLMIYGNDLVNVPPLRPAIRAEEAVIYGCYELAKQSK